MWFGWFVVAQVQVQQVQLDFVLMLFYYTNTVCFVIDVKASLLLSIIKAPPTHNTHHIIKLHPPKPKQNTKEDGSSQKKSPIKT